MPRPRSNWTVKKTTVVLIATVAFIILSAVLLPNEEIRPILAADGERQNVVEGYWWAPNAGWISLQGNNYSVLIDKSPIGGPPVFSGFAWDPNLGWISTSDTSGGDQYEVFLRNNVPITGNGPWPIDGYAWGPNIGWISFDAIDEWNHSPSGSCWPWSPADPDCVISDDEPQIKLDAVNPQDAKMAGYAWAPNFGWIDLSRASVPGWKDVTDPVLEYFDVQMEVLQPQGAEPYEYGLYKDAYDCCGGALSIFPSGHMVWVRPEIRFKAIMRSQDNNVRWQDLDISAVTANPQTIPELYVWQDRLRFRPGQEPPYTGSILSYDAALDEFLPNPDYAAGVNPDVPPTGGTVAVPAVEDINGDGVSENIWKSNTHFLSGTPTAANYALREFRYNIRDAGGNYACPDGTYDWNEGEGCIIPSLSSYSPMFGRVGVAVDHIAPAGSLHINTTAVSDDPADPTEVSAISEVPFRVDYVDNESGSYHLTLEYRLKSGGAWPLNWSGPIGERSENVGRAATAWEIDGDLGPGDTEKPLDTSSWADGQQFQLRLRVYDNVGNLRERIFHAQINRTPPQGQFSAADPIDRDPNRTRYAAVDLFLPASTTIKTMQFANTPDGFGSEFLPYPEAGGWEDDWSLEIVSGEAVTGGLKSIYANFCDGTAPEPVCTRDRGVEVRAQIAAPWFEGAQGDVYGGAGVGTRSKLFNGIAPYYTVGLPKYNATYRITSDGEIKPQITSQQSWEEENYADFVYPDINSTIAPIDFDNLLTQADIWLDTDVAKAGRLDFNKTTNGIILLQGSLPNGDATLTSAAGDRLIISGRGTLLVDGNLRIGTDLYYEDTLTQPNPAIDSLAILTRRTGEKARGNVYVDQSVRHLVGAYIVGLRNVCPSCPVDELGTGVFHSSASFLSGIGTPPALVNSKRELVLEGMVAARDFDLRRYSTGSQNFLANASLEGGLYCPPDWKCDPAEPKIFQVNSKNVVAGLQKLQITLPPGQKGSLWQTNVPISLQGETSLTLSGYLRSTLPGLPVKSALDVAVGAQSCVFQPETIDSQWRRFQCAVSAPPDTKSLDLRLTAINFVPNAFTLDLDAFQLEAGTEATAWHLKFEKDTNYMAAEQFFYDGRVILNTPPGLASLTSPTWGETVAD